MNYERIAEHFKTKLLDLGLTGITESDIKMPNAPFEPRSRPLWLEISVAPGDPFIHTEQEMRVIVLINLIVGAPTGSGTQRVNNVADRIQRIYSPVKSDRAGFRIGSTTRVYIREVTQLPGAQTSEGYKVNVRVTGDVYTKEF